ncbi:MAG TPA: hypothetical protein ENK02_05300, partial [Planctomycetes bacterium]|nr:hypothetical protein [Planctomycetota bacterium]
QRELMPKVREHLDLFHFREEMRLGEVEESRMLGVFGEKAGEEFEWAGEFRLGTKGSMQALGLGGWVVPGFLLLGPDAELRAFLEGAVQGGVLYGGVQAWEGLRIDSRLPRYGVDADETNLPLEVRLDAACHPDKGCYVGQEVVARIRNLGHVNRLLCLLRGEGDELPGRGTLLFDEDLEAGRVTSAYQVPGSRELHLLALLPRVLSAPGTEVSLGAEEGPLFEVVEPEGLRSFSS